MSQRLHDQSAPIISLYKNPLAEENAQLRSENQKFSERIQRLKIYTKHECWCASEKMSVDNKGEFIHKSCSCGLAELA